jgi:hypothetical protein
MEEGTVLIRGIHHFGKSIEILQLVIMEPMTVIQILNMM